MNNIERIPVDSDQPIEYEVIDGLEEFKGFGLIVWNKIEADLRSELRRMQDGLYDSGSAKADEMNRSADAEGLIGQANWLIRSNKEYMKLIKDNEALSGDETERAKLVADHILNDFLYPQQDDETLEAA